MSKSKIELEVIPNQYQDKSPRLMDIFMIVGYENTYINEKIIKDINKVFDPNNSKENEEEEEEEEEEEVKEKNISNIKEVNENGYGQYKCDSYPTIISSITSDLDSREKEENKKDFSILDFQFYLEMCLCSNPIIYFTNEKEKIPKEKIKVKDYIPSIITVKADTFCYSYMFYEEKQDKKITIFIPKYFLIVSKYQYYKIFHEICSDILNIFKSSKVQIPLEFQIYNLINQTPAPSDCKLQLSLLLNQEINMQKLNSINFYNNTKFFLVDRLSGYSQNQINFGLIFNLFDVKTIIEIFLQILLNTTIIFFSPDDEKLFFIITIFNKLMYPLLDTETVVIIPYAKYIQNELGQNLQNHYGLKVNERLYNKIKEKFQKQFNCNFYILLEEEKKELLSTYGKKKFDSPKDNQIYNLYNPLHAIIYEKEQKESKIGNILKNNKENLNKIYNEIKNKELFKSYYESNSEEIEMNIKIRNAFYKFNLDISNFMYLYEDEYKKISESLPIESKSSTKNVNENKISTNSSNLKIEENLDFFFYKQIITPYLDILKNFCKSESKDVLSENMRLARKIYTSFLSDLNSNPKENREIDYYRIIDSIYYRKNPSKSINFDFLDFYKYYYDKLDTYFSEVINKKYVNCISENVAKDIVKHYYTYKKIELDPELIMKYLSILDQIQETDSMREEENVQMKKKGNEQIEDNNLGKERTKLFKDEYLYISKDKTKNLDILNAIENYYFENNLLNYNEIIRLCIITYIILTIPKKLLVYFNKGSSESNDEIINFVYDLFDCISLFKNKYLEMFLSVSYRYFNNSNEINYFFIQPYFDIYKYCVTNRKILKTYEIFSLFNAFESFVNKIKKKNESKKVEHPNKNLINNVSDQLYEFENQINREELLSKIVDPKYNEELLINEKIKINYKYETKEASCEGIKSPKNLYKIIKNTLKGFYAKLDIKDINNEIMKDIGISLLFYCHLLKNDLPLDTSKYILLSLEN